MPVMSRLRDYCASMAGRLFLILLVGMLTAAMSAVLLANARRRLDFERQNEVRTADRLHDFVELLDEANPELRARLLSLQGPGVKVAADSARALGADAGFTAQLAARGGQLAQATAERADHDVCAPPWPDLHTGPSRDEWRRRAVADPSFVPPHCWLVAFRLADGTPLRLAVESPPVLRDAISPVDPVLLSLLTVAIALLAYGVSRIASAPLERLAVAATALGTDLQRAPMPVTGPAEVRRAAVAFNTMQQRLRSHIVQRMRMLAAITHDLQTPLTRLRLRLENVTDDALRERLVADLAAMQALIREGLELARSDTSSEAPVALDLDSLLASLVEDAAETGADARFERGCGAVLTVRPVAMQRLFSNLIDNGLKYGGSVRVTADREPHRVVVRVRDAGPGLPDEVIEALFEPFVRLEDSRSRDTGGTGLGLTIARMLAEKDGASLALRNARGGGMEAVVTWDRPDR